MSNKKKKLYLIIGILTCLLVLFFLFTDRERIQSISGQTIRGNVIEHVITINDFPAQALKKGHANDFQLLNNMKPLMLACAIMLGLLLGRFIGNGNAIEVKKIVEVQTNTH